MAAVIVLAAIAFVLFVYVLSGVKLVRPFQRGVVERLGKYKGTVEPGLRVIVPAIDRITRVDMREQVIDVPPQEVITSDNVVVSVDAVIYYEATDAQRLVYNVGDFILAVVKLAQTNLRNVVGDLQLDEALTSRDKINTALRDILDTATDRWGVRVVRVEIQRVDPPPDVMSAMHEVMKAERTRRAVVTEAQGGREAAITRAEGAKAAAILEAEGSAAATRQLAEAESFRQQTVAEGEAMAIQSVLKAIKEAEITPEVLAIKWFEALQVMSDGQASKIYLPAGPEGMASAIANLAELARAPETK
ncbi:MAG TPA: SPFH domain-containing protein [Acidimicrobiales bacterium]|nr:SPFH domain-containing protein [Acidimicrobiales bacterium]